MDNGRPVMPDTRDYFSFYGLEQKFAIDSAQLKNLFLEKSKQYHPDYFTADAAAQNIAVSATAYNNLAYKTLGSEVSRASYLLQLKSSQDEKNHQLPQAFLMEMMELNEAWMDADDEAAKQSILDQIKAIQDEILEPIKSYLEMDQIDSIAQEAMLQIKEYYYKKKYLDRILAEFR